MSHARSETAQSPVAPIRVQNSDQYAAPSKRKPCPRPLPRSSSRRDGQVGGGQHEVLPTCVNSRSAQWVRNVGDVTSKPRSRNVSSECVTLGAASSRLLPGSSCAKTKKSYPAPCRWPQPSFGPSDCRREHARERLSGAAVRHRSRPVQLAREKDLPGGHVDCSSVAALQGRDRRPFGSSAGGGP